MDLDESLRHIWDFLLTPLEAISDDEGSRLGFHYVAQDLGARSRHVYNLSAVKDPWRECMGKARLVLLGASLLGLCAAGYLMLKKDSDIRKIAHDVDSMIFTDDEIM